MILSYARTVILYLALTASLRLMGKRQIGQLEPSEFVVTMLVANLAAIPMQDPALPLAAGLMPMLTVVALELILSFGILKSTLLRRLLCGKPVILIDNGRLLPENLAGARISLDELMGHLRQKDVLDIRTVQYAILETNGNLSVFPYPRYRPASAEDAGITPERQYLPVTLIADGVLFKKDLARSGKDTAWLDRELAKHRSRVETTLLLTVDRAGNTVWLGKEKGQ